VLGFETRRRRVLDRCARGLLALAGLGLLGLLVTAGCTRADADQRVVLTGSSTVAPLMAEIGKRFEAQRPGARVDVQTGGSSRGVADVRRGVADLGMVSRALGTDEDDLVASTIAVDGIAIIVHRDNPVAALTDAQLAAIFTGELSDWREVGGVPGPITVVNKAEGRSTLELFLAHLDLRPQQIQARVVIGDNEQGIKTVAGSRAAIGYVSIGAAEHAAARGEAVRLLPLGGVEATSASVRQGMYPLSRPLLLVSRGPPDGLAAELVAFARSTEVHDIVAALSLVPTEP
jgi:phosphate transport system substrate-binding protein